MAGATGSGKEDQGSATRYADLLRAVVETAVDGILTIDRHGTVITANAAVERMFGFSEDELRGQNVRVLMPSPYHEAHDGYLRNYFETGVRKIIGIGREVRGRRRDGTEFPLELAVAETPTEDGVVFTGTLRDISERKAAEDALSRERSLLKAVFDTAADGILTVDGNGRIMTANPAVHRYFGYDPGEMEGRPLTSLTMADDPVETYVSVGRDEVPSGAGVVRETSGVRKSGARFPMEIAVTETVTEDARLYTCVVRDVTDAKRAREMKAAKEMAEQSSAAKSEFLSRMSHELRTPLNAVLGFAQLIEMKRTDPETREATGAILKAGQHLLNLINEVLDLARIEAGKLQLSVEPVSVTEVVRQALDLIGPDAQRSGLTVLVDEESMEGAMVLADRRRILQVLINVLSNAVKYNCPGGRIHVTSDREVERFSINVTDTGQGIDEADARHLFEPFRRFGDRSKEGTGLGLAVSKSFLELMGGSITLARSDRSGSTFSIGLVPTVAALPLEERELSRRLGEGPRFEGPKTVLYIEDNLSNYRLLELAFGMWGGIELLPAMQGEIGLVLALERLPDLILLDLHLPDMSGYDVLVHLKSDERTHDIPVVVISADATPSEMRRILKAGALDYLTKPVNLESLAKIVKSRLTQVG
ncbi:MAG: PAS domain S-box protein [Armatimonadetes bacterium]|nr:PAS domain S-box protein [Armatimonadota bacterium]